MRSEWLAVSAAALVMGATALFFGSHLIPTPGDGQVMEIAVASPELWMAASLILVLASLGLLLGISSLGPLLRGRGFGLGVLGMVLIAIAAVILFGFAQQLILLRALSIEAGIDQDLLSAALQEPVQQALMIGGFVCFYAGEVCIGVALLMARAAPRWVSWALIGHVVVALALTRFDAPGLSSLPSLLMVAGFLGAAISANRASMSGLRLRPAPQRASQRGH